MRTKDELVKDGCTDEEVTKKLARLHFEGFFSRPFYQCKKGRRETIQNNSTPRKREKTRITAPQQELISTVKEIIASTDNPDKDLPSHPGMTAAKKHRKTTNTDGLVYSRKIQITKPAISDNMQSKELRTGDKEILRNSEVICLFLL